MRMPANWPSNGEKRVRNNKIGVKGIMNAVSNHYIMRNRSINIKNALEMHLKSREEVLKAVRNIPKGRISTTGVVASKKGNPSVHFESGLEHDFSLLLEFNSFVYRFVEQPIKLKFTDSDGKKRSYTPDFLVYYRNDQKEFPNVPNQLIEVKTREHLKRHWGDLRPKFKEAIRYSAKEGWNFKIVTEREIYGPYFENAKYLLPYMKLTFEPGIIANVLSAMEELDIATPSEVLAAAAEDIDRKIRLVPALWYLIGQRVIGCDLTQKLTMESEIWY